MQLRLSPALAAVALLAGSVSCTTVTPRADLVGQPASPAYADRTIAITPDTRWVNVTGGETIRFVVDGKEFGWNFLVADTISVFDLNQVAPPGSLSRQVKVYVAPDPLYRETIGPHFGIR